MAAPDSAPTIDAASKPLNDTSMHRFLHHACLASLVMFLLMIGSLLLFERQTVEVTEVLLAPWLALCAYVTPQDWQVRGNALLGLAWLLSGLAAMAATLGVLAATIAQLLRKRRATADSCAD